MCSLPQTHTSLIKQKFNDKFVNELQCHRMIMALFNSSLSIIIRGYDIEVGVGLWCAVWAASGPWNTFALCPERSLRTAQYPRLVTGS